MIRKTVSFLFLLSSILLFSCDQKSPEDMMLKAEHYELKGDYKMANIMYDEIIREYPDYEGAYVNKGANFAENKDYKGAISIYKKGLVNFPKNVQLLENIGLNYNRLNMLDSANHYFSIGLKYVNKCETVNHPTIKMIDASEINQNKVESFELYYERGLNYYELENYDKCIVDMKECIRCGYYVASCHYMVGACLFEKGQMDESCEEFYIAAKLGDSQAQEQLNIRCAEIVEKIQANAPLK